MLEITVANVTTQVLSHAGMKVCTTRQLAEFYGCHDKNVADNYQNNDARFIEGNHYFKIEGAGLKKFKASLPDNIGGPLKYAPSITLWTEKGAARHAKMLSTDRAWDVFEQLEETYFAVAEQRLGLAGNVPALVEDISNAVMLRLGGMMESVVHKQVSDAMIDTLPAMIHGTLAKQQTMMRKGETSGQVWKRWGLPTKGLHGYPAWFGNRLAARGCQIDGGGRAESGGIPSRLFDPDKCDAQKKGTAGNPGLFAECIAYIQSRDGQGDFFGRGR